MSKIILASKSPRRIELLSALGLDISTCAADIDEESVTAPTPKELTQKLACRKAVYIAEHEDCGDSFIIAADTLVELDGRPLGKPKSEQDASDMLHLLSGKYHSVHTGIAILRNGRLVSAAETTKVKFLPLSDADIRRYVESGEPMDKAGAYGIQERGGLFVEGIEGDYFNVMGLPLCRLSRLIKTEFNTDLLDLI